MSPPSTDGTVRQPEPMDALKRALRLRCPYCGEGRPFRTWFHMKDCCESCGLRFVREPGYFVGALYFAYLPAAVLLIAIFFTVAALFDVGLASQWPFLVVVAVLFPSWWFRYSRLLWMAFDFRITPLDAKDFPSSAEREVE